MLIFSFFLFPPTVVPSSINGNDENKFRASIVVGELLDAFDVGDYYPAEVLQIETNDGLTSRVFIEYLGWDSRYNRWFDVNDRLIDRYLFLLFFFFLLVCCPRIF